MSLARYLIDTSALGRLLDKAADLPEWEQLARVGLIAVSAVTELEFLYSAKSASHRAVLIRPINELFLTADLDEQHVRRAHEVQRELTDRGEHRSAGPVDLIIAAQAEQMGLVLLHYDRDFETISRVTGQPTRWLAPAGSI